MGFKTAGAIKRDLDVDECIDLVKDCFTSAGERDIYTGDSVEICVITKVCAAAFVSVKYQCIEYMHAYIYIYIYTYI